MDNGKFYELYKHPKKEDIEIINMNSGQMTHNERNHLVTQGFKKVGEIHTELTINDLDKGFVARIKKQNTPNLTDKHGTKICEGDIVQIDGINGLEVAVMGFDNGELRPYSMFCGYMREIPYEIEVIGNIHDNPELLKTESECE